ncbi:uncharacterized protein ACA1_120790 [Acanthamoeba castellanii str. Neff]|uniref:RETREG1-3/ARL6IP-like N-terminal reticulon-homology domain-containing protein n=1 Tax=Acanthamoeba castellanii (strain ATCC 30010 / Neff) TaxID=1257118 RepID=L8GL18_ACACF|nr:uncharacterized protein ACA1_120790 [Acanthamoeba castellanii str. Neff]ELR13712.1 hypothetical protein ACA1_120790 [Acanthamoeba castellanii str. Neff]
MADLARRKKEDAIRLKAWLEPHLPSINRLQAILLWLDTTGQVQFVVLCVLTHMALGLGAHLAEGVTLPAVVPYALGLYLLARYAVVAAPIPWESILHFVLTVYYEMQRLRDINYAKYTAQVCAILFVVGLLLNRISGYTFIYIIVFSVLLLPGIYTHGVFGKLWSLAESHPQVGRVMGMAKDQYTKLASNLGFRPSQPQVRQQQPAAPAAPATTSTAGTTPTVSVGSSTVNVNSNAGKAHQPQQPEAGATTSAIAAVPEEDADDFVQIPSDKKHD